MNQGPKFHRRGYTGKTLLTNDQVIAMRTWHEIDGHSYKAVMERANLEFQLNMSYDYVSRLLSYELRTHLTLKGKKA